MKKILLSLIAVLLFCGASSADFIYATSTGSIGTITLSSSNDIASPSIKYAGNISSPLITSYWNGSGTNIALIDRYAGVSGDRAYIFSPTSLTGYSYSRDIPGVSGTKLAGYADNGTTLFLASGSKVYAVEASEFMVYMSFDCAKLVSKDGYATDVVCLNVDSSYIHVVASSGSSTKYLRFDGQLKDNANYFLSADAPYGVSTLLSTTNSLPIVGHESGIATLNSRRKFYDIMSDDYPVKAMCPDNSGGFFFADQEKSGDVYVNMIMHLARGDDYFVPEVITSYSPNITLIRDNSRTEYIAAMTDEAIRVITYKDRQTTSREYRVSELGGSPVGITAANVSGYDRNSNNSGCDAFGIGLAAVAMLFMLKRK